MDFSTGLLGAQSKMVQQARDYGQIQSLKRTAENAKDGLDKPALREACRGFEEIFLKQILKNMRKMSTGVAGMKEMTGSDQYWDMMDSAFATELSRADTLGIGKFVYESLVDQLERTSNEGTPAEETPRADFRA